MLSGLLWLLSLYPASKHSVVPRNTTSKTHAQTSSLSHQKTSDIMFWAVHCRNTTIVENTCFIRAEFWPKSVWLFPKIRAEGTPNIRVETTCFFRLLGPLYAHERAEHLSMWELHAFSAETHFCGKYTKNPRTGPRGFLHFPCEKPRGFSHGFWPFLAMFALSQPPRSPKMLFHSLPIPKKCSFTGSPKIGKCGL